VTLASFEACIVYAFMSRSSANGHEVLPEVLMGLLRDLPDCDREVLEASVLRGYEGDADTTRNAIRCNARQGTERKPAQEWGIATSGHPLQRMNSH
jgi:hypothetical protein